MLKQCLENVGEGLLHACISNIVYKPHHVLMLYGCSNCFTIHSLIIYRYLTIMVFLNDDYEGGEKCFPLADNKTFSQKVSSRDIKIICKVVVISRLLL